MSDKIIPGEKHFTASVWIVAKTNPKKILLVHHKKLGKWLQPGGHVEQFENPLEAAIREVREETGLDISFLSKEAQDIDSESSMLPLPTFLLEQKVSSYQDQPEHFHIDINYVLEVAEQPLKHQIEESHGIGWFSKDEALNLPIHGDTRVILQQLL